MKHILASAQKDLLEQLSWANVLLGFDFDGTLAPIVTDPSRAELRTPTRRLLGSLALLYPCVVISGRAKRDIERRLVGIALRGVVGNHGIEPGRATDEFRRTVEVWKERLAAPLAALSGVEIEDKTYSLAIHYRHSRHKTEARTRIARALASLGEVRIIGGKQVVNVLPLGAPHKGVAIEYERDRLGCDTAFFVGDDETDEDVFALDRPGRLLTVCVGPARASQASYCLNGQGEIDALLRRLIELRRSDAAQGRHFAR